MAREDADRKAARLLLGGAVRVVRADRRSAVVVVRGDHDRYAFDVADGAATCSCPARPGSCSHAAAALRVVLAGLPAVGRTIPGDVQARADR